MHRILLALLWSSFAALAAGESWPPVKFAEVRAYAWPGNIPNERVILPGMKLKPGAINPRGAVLKRAQVERLLAALKPGHRKHPVAACYDPHNAFVFYDAAGQPVAYVELCFGCINHDIQPARAEVPLDWVSLASIFDDHLLPMGEYSTHAHFKESFEKIVKRWENAE